MSSRKVIEHLNARLLPFVVRSTLNYVKHPYSRFTIVEYVWTVQDETGRAVQGLEPFRMCNRSLPMTTSKKGKELRVWAHRCIEWRIAQNKQPKVEASQ